MQRTCLTLVPVLETLLLQHRLVLHSGLSHPIWRNFQSHTHLKTRILGTIWADDFKSSIADVEVRFGAASNVGHNAKRLMPDALIAVCAPTTDPWDMLPLIEAVGTTESWKDWRGQSEIALSPEPTIFVAHTALRFPWR